MFSKIKQTTSEVAKSNPTTTVLAEGITVNDKGLSGQGDILINGIFIGNIELEGNLSIGESGNIKGNLTAKNIKIEGEIDGAVTAAESVYLHKSGKVVGDISCSSLTIDNGATFSGACAIGNVQNRPPVHDVD